MQAFFHHLHFHVLVVSLVPRGFVVAPMGVLLISFASFCRLFLVKVIVNSGWFSSYSMDLQCLCCHPVPFRCAVLVAVASRYGRHVTPWSAGCGLAPRCLELLMLVFPVYLALPGFIEVLIVADRQLPHHPMVDLPRCRVSVGPTSSWIGAVPGLCVVSSAGSSVQHPRQVLGLTTPLATVLSPILRLL